MITLMEIIDIVIMSIIIGFIFKDFFSRLKHHVHDSPEALMHSLSKGRIDWDGMKIAIMLTAPAIILHELGHKIAAMAFGMQAVFHAAYGWLFLGVVLKLMNFGVIFFVPAYVSISGRGTPLDFAIVAFAGPGVNLVLWLGCLALVKYDIVKKRKFVVLLSITAKINMFLFIFNMLPIPGFDGHKVFSGLLRVLG